MTYSVAIRTLCLDPDTLRRVLEGVFAQSIRPVRVIIYIAKGYAIPEWRVGNEEYIPVRKGMMAQRALRYDEIDTPYILMLDDDILLEPDTAAKLLATAEREHTALLSADIFATHLLPFKSKLYSALTGFAFPHFRQDKAFKMRPSGGFSYISHPRLKFYKSDTCGGPLMFWRKDSFLKVKPWEENWMDALGFSFGDDGLISYKATSLGMKTGIDFSVKVTNLDAGTCSNAYRNDSQRFYFRTLAILKTWHRMCYTRYGTNRSIRVKARAILGLIARLAILTPVMGAASLSARSLTPLSSYLRALRDNFISRKGANKRLCQN